MTDSSRTGPADSQANLRGSRPRVLIAAELEPLLPEDPLPGYEAVWISTPDPTPRGDFVAAILLLSRSMGEEELEGLPKLQVLAQCAVGYDNIDLGAAARRGIPVTNTPDVLTESTADLAWALILAVARRMKEGQEMLAQGTWSGWSPTQLGMRVSYSDAEGRPDFERAVGAERSDLPTLLAESDVVTLHLPSTAETRGIFDAHRFSLMKPGSLFINTARGDLVDEGALLESLDEGRLGGAGLDVFSREPQVPRELVEHPRVVALPHIGSATTQTRRAMAELAVKNALEVLAGREPLTPVKG